MKTTEPVKCKLQKKRSHLIMHRTIGLTD